MIPTEYKSKLRKGLSWPLGAEAITAGLGDAPHVADLSLWFTDRVTHPVVAFQRVVRDALPYILMVAEYRPERRGYIWPNSMAKSGWSEAKWELHVSPAPSPWRAAAGAALREVGLPAVIDWLRSSERVGWELQRQHIQLVFAAADGTLTSQVSVGV